MYIIVEKLTAELLWWDASTFWECKFQVCACLLHQWWWGRWWSWSHFSLKQLIWNEYKNELVKLMLAQRIFLSLPWLNSVNWAQCQCTALQLLEYNLTEHQEFCPTHHRSLTDKTGINILKQILNGHQTHAKFRQWMTNHLKGFLCFTF